VYNTLSYTYVRFNYLKESSNLCVQPGLMFNNLVPSPRLDIAMNAIW
jgi:hypothetical protein